MSKEAKFKGAVLAALTDYSTYVQRAREATEEGVSMAQSIEQLLGQTVAQRVADMLWTLANEP